MIHKPFFSKSTLSFGFLALLFSSVLSLCLVSLSVNAQEGFDDEAIVVHVKKIRDEDSNYLRGVTKAAAREITKGGEFEAKLHKRNAKGPVIEVRPPAFNFAKYQEGMSTKEMATAGLSLVSEVGSMFGFGEEAAKVNEMNARINSNNSLLAAWGEDEQVMVTMESRVLLIDDTTGIEISRSISYEQVFDSKSSFMEQKESIIQTAVVGEVKKVLVEYLEDME
ncbi:hypothetical protein ACFO4O_10190 [Glaciecola siphonariae]|uniref:Lipoprotein n=1 Tax=Glaciecola siphonariae TaxID=521012 RepID=A0ABV9LXH0_9ALTE